MLQPEHGGYLAVRDLDGEGAPDVGAGWTVHLMDAGWCVLERENIVVAAWKANELAGRGLFAVFGPQDFLENLASANTEVMPGREAWARRSEANIRAWLRYWPVWRVDGFERDDEGNPVAISGGVRRLLQDGDRLPDPTVDAFPWDLDEHGDLVSQASAVIRVTGIVRPAMANTIRSEADNFDLQQVMEDEPERG